MKVTPRFHQTRHKTEYKCIYFEDILIPTSQAIKKRFGHKNFTFQQDSAPSQTSSKTQAWCRANFQNFWSKEM